MENKKNSLTASVIFKKIQKRKGLFLAAVLPFIFWGVILVLWLVRAPQAADSSPTTTDKKSIGQASISQIAESAYSVDSDHDGLPNWEEQIYGTDPHNPDTDGDGYLDGEEILSGHDPLKKGPNDLLAMKIIAPLTKEEQNKKTASEAFARVAMTNFFNNKDAQQSLSNMSPDQLDAKLKESFGNDPASITQFQEQMRNVLYDFVPVDLDSKIKIIKQPVINKKNPTEQEKQKFADELQKYQNDFSKIISEVASKYSGPALHQLITDAFEQKDFSNLDSAGKYYSSIYDKLLNTSVPESLLSTHREILQLFYETATALKVIKNWDSDPAKALVAIEKINAWGEKFSRSSAPATTGQ